jgi:hypothetical protein
MTIKATINVNCSSVTRREQLGDPCQELAAVARVKRLRRQDQEGELLVSKVQRRQRAG